MAGMQPGLEPEFSIAQLEHLAACLWRHMHIHKAAGVAVNPTGLMLIAQWMVCNGRSDCSCWCGYSWKQMTAEQSHTRSGEARERLAGGAPKYAPGGAAPYAPHASSSGLLWERKVGSCGGACIQPQSLRLDFWHPYVNTPDASCLDQARRSQLLTRRTPAMHNGYPGNLCQCT